jgi:integrase
VLRSSRLEYKVSVPAKQDVRALIDGSLGRLRAMLVVSALCGLRASETRGLRWADVDFADGFLHVRQRADFYRTLGEPKSAAGHRSVPAGPLVLNTLIMEDRLPEERARFGLPVERRIGLRSCQHGGRHFKPLCDKLKIRLRWHDMRHFAVSLWIEQGFSIKEVMTFAGHSSVQMTMERYGHLFPTPDHQKAMALVEQRMFGGKLT